jgi:hypothetical protein
MLFDPDFCNGASGWEQGVVEKPSRIAGGVFGKTQSSNASVHLRN